MASFLFAYKMPLANPAIIMTLPRGASMAYLIPRESPLLASITLATRTRIEDTSEIPKRLVKEEERVAKLPE